VIPPVETRQVRPCTLFVSPDTDCVFWRSDDSGAYCDLNKWRGCDSELWAILRPITCDDNFTAAEMREIISEHNSRELPGWVKEKIKEDLQYAIYGSHDLTGIQIESIVKTLEWVLSLKREG
jgi:hypothetical protein